jgi:hypothetical protein
MKPVSFARASCVAAATLLASLAATSLVQPLLAQSDPRLVDVVRLAQDGLSDSARATVSKILSTTSPQDSVYPEVLYTTGLVSKSVDEMRRAYQRVAIEYPTSAWADDALLRLAMLDYAAADPNGTVRNLERLRQDYSGSDLIPLASYWAARAYFDLKKPAEACRWLDSGLAQVGDNIELHNQLDFFHNRCTVLAAQPAESTRTDTTRKPPAKRPAAPRDTASPPSAATPPAPGFSVQVGAVKTKSAADDLAARVKGAGIEPHIVSEGGYFKVRAGRFSDRAKATAAAARLLATLGGKPYVVAEP